MDVSINKQSVHDECHVSHTDLFSKPLVQKDIQNGFYEEIHPSSRLEDARVI